MPSMSPARRPAGRRDPLGAPWPGLIPLRPLALGEIFQAAARLVRAHAAVLCSLALLGSLLSAGAVIAVLASISDRSAYFSDQWLTQMSTGKLAFPPAAVLWPLAAGGIIGFVTTIVVSGLATALAADDALGRPTNAAAAFGRLRGRWLVLIGVSLLVGALVFVGVLAFIIPGLLILAALLLATPVVVIEKAGPGLALSRSAQLSRGFRARILGTMVLAYLISSMVGTLILYVVPAASTIGGALVTVLLQAVISAFTVPWTAGVVALLYIDTRIRKENLAATLIRASGQG